MRTAIGNLPTAHPLGERLPAVYLDDDFATRLTSAFDEVLAPVLLTLDCFSGYLDPRIAPPDFLAWLGTWVALAVDEGWSGAQPRELVARAVELHRWRGTRRGLAEHVELLTGGDVTIEDSGGCDWSPVPGGPLPGTAPAHVTVRVSVADPGRVDQRLRAAIAELVPAHVTVTVEILARR